MRGVMHAAVGEPWTDRDDKIADAATAIALRMIAADGQAPHLAVWAALRAQFDPSPSEVWRALMRDVPSRLARDPASGYFTAPRSEP